MLPSGSGCPLPPILRASPDWDLPGSSTLLHLPSEAAGQQNPGIIRVKADHTDPAATPQLAGEGQGHTHALHASARGQLWSHTWPVPLSAPSWLCDFGRLTEPLRGSVSLLVKCGCWKDRGGSACETSSTLPETFHRNQLLFLLTAFQASSRTLCEVSGHSNHFFFFLFFFKFLVAPHSIWVLVPPNQGLNSCPLHWIAES